MKVCQSISPTPRFVIQVEKNTQDFFGFLAQHFKLAQ